MRAIGLVRVSQRDDDTGRSPEVQVRAMLKQAAADGFTLDPADIWDENVDGKGRIRPASGSATLADRPKLEAAVQAVERGEAGIIVAERFDRLFRDLDVQRAVIDRVEKAGGRLITAAGQISHATAEDELHANLNGSIAHYTKRTAMERSRAAVELAIEEGRVPWDKTTPGYRRTENGHYEVDAAAATTVEEAFRLRDRGASLFEVRAFLRDRGIERTYHGVRSLLKSRVVLGELHFGRYAPNLTAWPPIVDRDLWHRVQAASAPRGRKAKSDRLLSRQGILLCGTCGGRMAIAGAANGKYRVYRCNPTGDCVRRVSVMADVAERVVVEKTRAHLEGTAAVKAVRQNVRRAAQDAQDAQDAYEAAGRAFTGHEDVQAFRDRLAALKAARDDARRRAARIQAPDADDITTLLYDDWDSLSLADKRRCIKAVVEKAVVRPHEYGDSPEDRIEMHVWPALDRLAGRTPQLPSTLA